MIRIGIDVGGTQIKVGAVTDGGRLLTSAAVPTGAGRLYTAMIDDMAGCVAQLLARQLHGIRVKIQCFSGACQFPTESLQFVFHSALHSAAERRHKSSFCTQSSPVLPGFHAQPCAAGLLLIIPRDAVRSVCRKTARIPSVVMCTSHIVFSDKA